MKQTVKQTRVNDEMDGEADDGVNDEADNEVNSLPISQAIAA